MSIARQGGILPQRNFIPQLYTTRLQAKYYADNVVPLIANHDYDEDVSKMGDTVNIRKRTQVDIKDYTLGQDLVTQDALADDAIQLTIDYGDYFAVPVRDVDRFQSDIDFATNALDEAAKALSTKAERRVLQSIYTVAGSTVTAAALDATNALKFLMQASLKLNQANAPQADRWAIIDPITAYFMNLSDLRYAYLTGDPGTPLRSGISVDKPVAGFKVYISNNLNANASISKILCGHRDALCFASQISETETVRNTADFGDILRGLNIYGYKVTKPEALVLVDVTSFGAL